MKHSAGSSPYPSRVVWSVGLLTAVLLLNGLIGAIGAGWPVWPVLSLFLFILAIFPLRFGSAHWGWTAAGFALLALGYGALLVAGWTRQFHSGLEMIAILSVGIVVSAWWMDRRRPRA